MAAAVAEPALPGQMGGLAAPPTPSVASAAAAKPPSKPVTREVARRALAVLRSDLRNILDEYPLFREFFWKHPAEAREGLVSDWQSRYETESFDYSGKTKNLREWMERCVAGGMLDASTATPTATPTTFSVGQEVRMRDPGEEWQTGTVHSIKPLRIRPQGCDAGKNWRDAIWHEVAPLAFPVGQRVRVRDRVGEPWKPGRVKAQNPLRITLDGGDGAHSFACVDTIPQPTGVPRSAAPADVTICLLCQLLIDTPGPDEAGVGLPPPSPGDDASSKGGTLSRVCDVPQHVFHSACLKKYMERVSACPVCGSDAVARPPPAQAAAGTAAGSDPAGQPGVGRGGGGVATTPTRRSLRPGDEVTVKGEVAPGVVAALVPPAAEAGGVGTVAVELPGVAGVRHVPASDLIGTYFPPCLGQRVEIFGLQGAGAEASNGRVGTCIGFLERRAVVLLEGTLQRKAFRIRNLRMA